MNHIHRNNIVTNWDNRGIDITIIDRDRVNAITELAKMGAKLAEALAVAPRVDISGCTVANVTGSGISISSRTPGIERHSFGQAMAEPQTHIKDCVATDNDGGGISVGASDDKSKRRARAKRSSPRTRPSPARARTSSR